MPSAPAATAAPPATARATDRFPAWHHLIRWTYGVIYSFLGANIVASIIQAIGQSGTVPTWSQITQTYPFQLAAHDPLVFWPTLVLLGALGIGGAIVDARWKELTRPPTTAEVHQIAATKAADAVAPIAVDIGAMRVDIADIKARVETTALDAPGETYGPPFEESLLFPPEQLIGRDTEYAWLLARLRAGETAGITALRGMGGLGKTALAAVAARALRQEHRFPDGIAVIACEDQTDTPGQPPTTAVTFLQTVLAHFDSRRRTPDATDRATLVAAVNQHLSNKRALVIFDNVEPGWPVEQVTTPLREAGLTLLLTARQRLPLPDAAMKQLDTLTPAAALDLFALSLGRGTGQDLTPAEQDAARRIVRTLDFHTYAVKLAGNYARERHDLAALARELEDPQAAVLRLPDADTPHAVALMFTKSTHTLPPETQRFFAALAAFPTPEFARHAVLALGAAVGIAAPETAVDLLVRRALLDTDLLTTLPEDGDRERLRIHPLARGFAATLLAPDQREQASQAVAAYYAAYANRTNDRFLEPDEANITGALEWAHDHQQDDLTLVLCQGMQYYWRNRGRTATALRALPWAVVIAEAQLGDKPVPGADPAMFAAWQQRADRLFWLRYNLGFVTQLSGQNDAAERLFTQNLQLAQQASSRRNQGAVLWQLGDVAERRGRLDDAERYFLESLAIRRGVQDRPGEGADLSRLGDVAERRGWLDDAERYYLQALEIDREVQDRQGEGVVLSNLGQVAQRRGRLDDAERYSLQALDILREVQDRQGEGVDLSRLGQVAFARGQLDDAERYYLQALDILREVQDQPSEGGVLSNLGQVAFARGRLDDAERYYLQSLEIVRAVQDRQGEGVDLSRLWDVAVRRRRVEDAERFLDEALALLRNIQDQRFEGITHYYLGQVAQQRGTMDDAERSYLHALDLLRKTQDAYYTAQAAATAGEFFLTVRLDAERGCTLLQESIALWQRMGNTEEADKVRETAQRLGCA